MNKLLPTLAAVMLLTGCAGSNDQIVPDCCYQGSITAARLSDLPMKLDEGGSVPVSQALDGFRPMPGFGGSRYPVREVDLRLVIESDMAPIFNSYDANRSTHLEQPELTVLYLIEAARGLGMPVTQLGDAAAITAIDTSASDIMGLVQFVRDNKQRMNRTAQKVFSVMEDQRYWHRMLNSNDADSKRLVP